MIESKTFIPKSPDTDQKDAYRQLALTQEEFSRISLDRTRETGVSPSQSE
ncbi:hypothetical protein [Burkholderia cepacia]|nr:hypothetical protein [Burkholderia cepacia]MDO5947184.1 hypothetical protein [Burkholderia cepacia]